MSHYDDYEDDRPSRAECNADAFEDEARDLARDLLQARTLTAIRAILVKLAPADAEVEAALAALPHIEAAEPKTLAALREILAECCGDFSGEVYDILREDDLWVETALEGCLEDARNDLRDAEAWEATKRSLMPGRI